MADWYCESDFQVDVRQCIKARLLHEEDTRYQKLRIYNHRVLGRVLVLDDVIQTTQKDEFVYHEMLTQVALTALAPADSPADSFSVLIIGGGDGGILREVLRHDWVDRVVMVEIDEAVIRTTREYLGIHGDYEDPRVKLRIGDGSAYVATKEAHERPFDLVIVDAPDPIGPAKLLYADDFTSNLASSLKPKGAIVRHLGLPFYMLEVLKDGTRQLRSVFGSVEVYKADVPSYLGGNIAFAISIKDGSSARTPRIDFRGRYYNPEIHRAAFVLPTWWQEAIIPE